ncbi:ATP-binding cassette domain-containing protein [Streptomyces sp. CB02400]|uniref:ATP-binding cassette domain-containing protein n=1 Tax=Streptomyces sp. CB02400 TaxID=1703944 RepID=UPI001300F212|nr:ABC transporter ATP-binding protein [Streptomyces sp. CB02400]
MAAERAAVTAMVAWSLLEAVPVLLSGWLMASALDRGFLAADPGTGLAFLGAYAAALFLGAVGARQVMTPLGRVVESVRDRLVRLVVVAGLGRAAKTDAAADSGDVARTTRQTETVRQMTAALLMTARTVVFSVAAVVLGLLALAPEVALVTVLALTAGGVLLLRLSRLLRGRLAASLAAEERLAEEAGQVLRGLRDVHACGAARTAASQVGKAVDDQAAAVVAAGRLGAGRLGVVAVGSRLPLLATLVMAPWLVRSGTATPGEVIGTATYLVTGLEPALRSVVHTIANVGLHLGVLLLRLADHVTVPPEPTGTTAQAPSAELTLHRVTFAYGPHSAPVVDRLSLSVEEGKHLAVMGPSGAGKSTLAALLAGLERPDGGEVCLGGLSVTELDRTWLRRTVVLVPQESYVFAGTVRENLAYLRADSAPDDQELERVITLFGLDTLVARLGGPDAAIERPGALSEGERQLLVLARVYLSTASVVILDEATCHLDPLAEARAEQAFVARPGSLVVIAHRISSVLRAPRVLVVESGTVVDGTHRELRERSPLYAELIGP